MSDRFIKNCPCCGTFLMVRVHKKVSELTMPFYGNEQIQVNLFPCNQVGDDSLYCDDGQTIWHLPVPKEEVGA